jgi:hypothetical protein
MLGYNINEESLDRRSQNNPAVRFTVEIMEDE